MKRRKALKELNLNNRGCKPTAKLTTTDSAPKGLNFLINKTRNNKNRK